MAANVQHADAITLVLNLEEQILKDPDYHDVFRRRGGPGANAASDGRHIGQVTSRIDAACFYAKTPFLAMHRVRETHGGKINPRSFTGDLWRPHTSAFVARADAHVWRAEDFKNIKTALHSLGDDAATLQWQKIERFGEKGVHKALGLSASTPPSDAG